MKPSTSTELKVRIRSEQSPPLNGHSSVTRLSLSGHSSVTRLSLSGHSPVARRSLTGRSPVAHRWLVSGSQYYWTGGVRATERSGYTWKWLQAAYRVNFTMWFPGETDSQSRCSTSTHAVVSEFSLAPIHPDHGLTLSQQWAMSQFSSYYLSLQIFFSVFSKVKWTALSFSEIKLP